jgi:hypothetical protein
MFNNGQVPLLYRPMFSRLAPNEIVQRTQGHLEAALFCQNDDDFPVRPSAPAEPLNESAVGLQS